MPSRSKTPAKRRGKKSSGEATAVTTAATLHSGPRAAGRALVSAAILLSVLVHFELRHAEFVWDDRAAIKGNSDVHGATPISSIWYHDFWGQKLASSTSHKSYRPLCVLAFRINYWWSGLDASSYHVANVVLHSITTGATFWLAHVLLKIFLPGNSPRANSVVPLAAGFTSLLFSVHPVHVEAVAGLVSRADIMAALAMILCLVAYVRAKQSGSPVLYVVSLMLALFASLSKETGATVVLLMLLLEVLPFEGDQNRKKPAETEGTLSKTNSLSLSPSVRIAATVCATAIFFTVRVRMHGGHSLREWQLMENHLAVLSTTSLQRWMTIAHTHARYAQFALLPQRGMLAYDHGFNSNTTAVVLSWQDPRNIGTLIAYSAVFLTLVLIARKRSRFLLFALAATLIPLAPALNVVFWVGTLLAERLLYIPSIGICLGAGYVIALPFGELYQERGLKGTTPKANTRASFFILRRGYPMRSYAYSTLILLLVGNMSLHSYYRSLDWIDEERIYKSGYESEPYSVKIINNYAQILLRSGKRDDAAEADRILQVSIKLASKHYPSAVFNRGLALSTLGDKMGAVRLFVQALSQYPSDDRAGANVHAYLAQELMEMHYDDKLHAGENAMDYSGTYRSDSAGYLGLIEWHCLRALFRGCKMPLVHFTLGNVYQETRRHDSAVAAYALALQMNKNPYLEKGYSLSETDARNMLGLAYQSRLKDCKSAKHSGNSESVEDALRRNVTESLGGNTVPTDLNLIDIISVVERTVVASCADSLAHDADRAINEYTKCIDMDPNFFQALVNAGVMHDENGDLVLAEKSYLRALEINPDHGMLLNNLAVVVLKRGRFREALKLAERSFALSEDHPSIRLTYQRSLRAVAKWLSNEGVEIEVEGGVVVKKKKPLEALNLFFKIFELGPAHPSILEEMVQTFSTIESDAERQQSGGALIRILDSLRRMPAELARKELSELFFVSLASALESIEKNTEADEVRSLRQQILESVPPQDTVPTPLLSFSVSEAPENAKFEYFDGQVAEVAGLEFSTRHGLTPQVEWVNKLAQAVRDNLSPKNQQKEASLKGNRGALLFLVPVRIPAEKESARKDVLMFCEKDRENVTGFVDRLCLHHAGKSQADRLSCAKIVRAFVDKSLN